VVEHLPSKHKALSSTSLPQKIVGKDVKKRERIHTVGGTVNRYILETVGAKWRNVGQRAQSFNYKRILGITI
jgi:hypothetical protein